MKQSRRLFVRNSLALAGGFTLAPSVLGKMHQDKEAFFEISLAEWSLHKALFGRQISNLDFPGLAKNTYGIGVVEYVNQFFKDKAEDHAYLNELLTRCRDNGVKNHLIMIDGEGNLADPDSASRKKAVENHYKWVHAAKYLGCRTIRVNLHGEGSNQDVQQAAIEGLNELGDYGQKEGINIIVENHGGYSGDGSWLATVMKTVNRKNVGTLPDFGNFCIKRDTRNACVEPYDRYLGTSQMIPFAKGVSAKTYDFDAEGNCVETDYYKMFKIIKEAGFTGYIGIEYEGEQLSEEEGIKKTKNLIEKVSLATGYKMGQVA
ncbi:MAG: sugar phosphate isomerase/epimerase family protein [Flavisolibacter sp.]